jgi:hypothetical protein
MAEGLSSNFWLSVLLSIGAYVLVGFGIYTLAYVVGIVAIIYAILVVLGRS